MRASGAHPPLDPEILMSGLRVKNIAAFEVLQKMFLQSTADEVKAHVLDCILQV